MKNVLLFLVILSCISCSRYGEDGDGNGNLKHEILTEDCETKPNYISWLFLHPDEITTCYKYYKKKKFTGTSVSYHTNGNIVFIKTYDEGEEVIEKREEYDENGVLLISPEFY